MSKKRVALPTKPSRPNTHNRGQKNPTPNRGVGSHPVGPKKP